MANILVVDDENDMLQLIKTVLEKDSHIVTTACDGETVLDLNYQKFDLIILDVMMPNINGFELCKKIRNEVICPIIFLTAKTLDNDVILGLSIGADDYITKPFSIGVLKAKVNSHLRRQSRDINSKKSFLNLGNIKIDLNAKEILVDECKIHFTKSEYAICEYLAVNRGQVFSREQIYEKIYGYEGKSDESAISEHIKNIRNKLKKKCVSPIETVWGIGYKWQ